MIKKTLLAALLLFIIFADSKAHASAFSAPEFGIYFDSPKDWHSERENYGNSVKIKVHRLNEFGNEFNILMTVNGTGTTLTLNKLATATELELKKVNAVKLRKTKVKIGNVPAYKFTYDLFLEKKHIGKGELYIVARENVSYVFTFNHSTRYFRRFLPAYRKLLKSVIFTQFNGISAEKTYENPSLKVYFKYPGTWQLPKILLGSDFSAVNIWQGTDAIWNLIIAPECEWCGFPYLYPLVLQKFDRKNYTLDYFIEQDKSKIIYDDTKNDIRIVVTKGFVKNLEMDINYYIATDGIYRLVGDRDGIEEADGQVQVFESFEIKK